MTLSLELALRAAMLNGIETFLNDSGTATLNVFQTNTLLATFNLNATPLGSAVSDSIVATSLPISNTGTAVAGKANHFTIKSETGILGMSGSISAIGGGGDLQVPSVLVTAAATQKLNSLVFRMAADGSLDIEGSLTLV